jgi:hypothetical protein
VETGDPIALAVQKLFALRVAPALIVGRMSRAVDLDDELLLAANEVGEIGTDRLLPNEFELPRRRLRSRLQSRRSAEV